jgi:hypothetical protein
MPQPITPIVIRLEAEGGLEHHALAGMTLTALATLIKSRRDKRVRELDFWSFIIVSLALPSVRSSSRALILNSEHGIWSNLMRVKFSTDRDWPVPSQA